VTEYELTPELLELMAARFKALGERARLQILVALREGERPVSEIAEATGLGQANLSKHLQILYAHGFVSRRRHQSWVIYELADASTFQLCDIMCRQLKLNVAVRGHAMHAK